MADETTEERLMKAVLFETRERSGYDGPVSFLWTARDAFLCAELDALRAESAELRRRVEGLEAEKR